MSVELFKTIHGSHLYGLDHSGSDWDYYTVLETVPKKRAKYARQTITGDEDSMVVDFGTWMEMCRSGVPQALEAMFSHDPFVQYDKIREFRDAFRVSTGASERYIRTITSFAMTQDPKRKRHGLRLAFNMWDFTRYGRFNPTLSPNEVDYVTEHAKRDCDAVYALAMNIALDRLPPKMVR